MGGEFGIDLIKPEGRRLKNKFYLNFLSQCLAVLFVKVFLQLVFREGRLSKRKQGVSYLVLDLATAILWQGSVLAAKQKMHSAASG